MVATRKSLPHGNFSIYKSYFLFFTDETPDVDDFSRVTLHFILDAPDARVEPVVALSLDALMLLAPEAMKLTSVAIPSISADEPPDTLILALDILALSASKEEPCEMLASSVVQLSDFSNSNSEPWLQLAVTLVAETGCENSTLEPDVVFIFIAPETESLPFTSISEPWEA